MTVQTPANPGPGNPEKKPGGAVARAVRDQRALQLRLAGLSFPAIAAELGWKSKASAFEAVNRALTEHAATTEQERERYRREQVARIETWLAPLTRRILQGDDKAVNAGVRLLERQARLLGLDAPTRVTVSDTMDGEIEALLQSIAALPQPADTRES